MFWHGDCSGCNCGNCLQSWRQQGPRSHSGTRGISIKKLPRLLLQAIAFSRVWFDAGVFRGRCTDILAMKRPINVFCFVFCVPRE